MKEQIGLASDFLSKEELVEKINRGETLLIAGDESILVELPSGSWVGGTIPYFMTEVGQASRDKAFVHTVTGITGSLQPRLSIYDAKTINRIAVDAPTNGFTILILPAMSEVHQIYAERAPAFPEMFFSPIAGWISGVHLDDLGEAKAKVGFGPSASLFDQSAVAIHIPLPEHQHAVIDIVNLFVQGSGPEITFPTTGFNASKCVIDGQEWALADYIAEKKIETKLPLVADYSGVQVNVSIQSVDNNAGEVSLYAPVFSDQVYRFADPIGDYMQSFDRQVKEKNTQNIAFSCNCILNYLYSELDGRTTEGISGPITFGEVAYQLVNQTMVYLKIESQ